jgi:cob(I)alamin adenosyltransferase
MKIYTRTGDTGSTGLFGGPRVPKDDLRIEAYGTVDELNAVIGMVRSTGVTSIVDQQLGQIQSELFSIGAELATPNPDSYQLRVISQPHIQQLEAWIDEHESGLPELKCFILPVGDPGSTHLHLARAVCRRAERRLVTLANSPDPQRTEAPISKDLIVYLNRLSDLLFVLTRVANRDAGFSDTPWVSPRQRKDSAD